MYRRPDSITAIGTLLCIAGAIYAIAALLVGPLEENPLQDTLGIPIPTLIVHGVGGLLTLLTGIYLLMGQGWARWFYVVLFVSLFAYDAIFEFSRLHWVLLDYFLRGIGCVFIFLPESNRYFRDVGRRARRR